MSIYRDGQLNSVENCNKSCLTENSNLLENSDRKRKRNLAVLKCKFKKKYNQNSAHIKIKRNIVTK